MHLSVYKIRNKGTKGTKLQDKERYSFFLCTYNEILD